MSPPPPTDVRTDVRTAVRTAVRSASGRALGGVATGVADHLGVPVLAVRAAFVVLAVAGGFGVVLYAAFWLVLPQGPAGRGGHRPARPRRGAPSSRRSSPSGSGAALLLPHASARCRCCRCSPSPPASRWCGSRPTRRSAAAGAAPPAAGGCWRSRRGAVLLVLGLAGFLASRGELGAAREGLLSTGARRRRAGRPVSGPWWLRLTADLRHERRERIRSQERAEVAAHVHDSVLQTLALIRKAADDPREVARLARTQERELRGWLYAPEGPVGVAFAAAAGAGRRRGRGGARGRPSRPSSSATRRPTRALLALVAAAREALVNAALHAGVGDGVAVRRGRARAGRGVRPRPRPGFDPAAVPADRHGVRGSIVGRMERHGGKAVVRSAPGEGTEVRLEVPRG